MAGHTFLAEAAVRDRGPHGAAGLVGMAAVVEPAGRGDLRHVVERGLEPLLGPEHLEGADPGRVDQQRAAGQLEELPMRRRVPAARIRLAHGSRPLAVLAEQRVENRRLADARGTEDRGSGAGAKVSQERLEPIAGRRRHRHDRHAPSDRLDLDTALVHVVADIGLVEDDDRVDPARPRDGQVPLDPPKVEVVVEPRDEERNIDVRGHDLLVVETGAATRAVGGHSTERRTPRQDRSDRATLVEGDPIADDREVHGGQGLEAEHPRYGRRAIAGGVTNDRRVAMHGHDASRTETLCRMRRKGLLPAGVPAERTERHVGRHAQPTRFSLPVRFA